MKKINEFEIIGIGVIIYLICLVFGIISKHVFGFDTDVLSASATLVAALVALYLYSDWKDAHKINTLESLKLNLQNNFNQLDSIYDDLRRCLMKDLKIENNLFTEYSILSKKLNLELETACQNLNCYYRLLINLKVDSKNLKVNPVALGKQLIQTYETVNIPFDLQYFDKMFLQLREKVFDPKFSNFTSLKLQAISLNSEIQQIIIRNLEKS